MHRKTNTTAWIIKGNKLIIRKDAVPHDIIHSLHYDFLSIHLQAESPDLTEV